MVATSIKQKKIVLMKVEDILNRPNDSNLANLLSNAWKSKVGGKTFSDDIDVREQSLPSGDSVVMNRAVSKDKSFLGEIVSFEPDGYLIVANRDKAKDKSKLHLRQILTDENEDPYKGITFFYAFKDYVLFLDSGVRYQIVSRYLSWMISIAYGVTKGVHVKLNPEIEFTGNQAKVVKATTLEIRPKPISPTTPLEGYIDQRTTKSETIKDEDTADRVLRALNFDYKSFQRYREETEGAGKIEVQVFLKLRNKRKLVPVSKNLPLAAIMDSNQDAEFLLKGKGGSSKGRLVRANYLADIRYEGSLIDKDSVTEAFRVALKDFIARDCIK